jgi:hypothetical protein
MPPSVARSQLPKDSAHATKEPLAKAGVSAFLSGCCTNNTRLALKHRRKLLFLFVNLDRIILTEQCVRKQPLTGFSPSQVPADIESNEAYANPPQDSLRRLQCVSHTSNMCREHRSRRRHVACSLDKRRCAASALFCRTLVPFRRASGAQSPNRLGVSPILHSFRAARTWLDRTGTRGCERESRTFSEVAETCEATRAARDLRLRLSAASGISA